MDRGVQAESGRLVHPLNTPRTWPLTSNYVYTPQWGVSSFYSGVAFVKFGKYVVQKLSGEDFVVKLEHYLELHKACKRMLASEVTISDSVVLEFEEACAVILVEAPNMLGMFRGELGEPGELAQRASKKKAGKPPNAT